MTQNKLIEQDPDDKVFGILAYLSILCILPLLFKRNSEFVLFHSKQGLVLFIGEVALFILSIVFSWFLKLEFILFAVSFFGIIDVLRGQKTVLPVITEIADRISI